MLHVVVVSIIIIFLLSILILQVCFLVITFNYASVIIVISIVQNQMFLKDIPNNKEFN